MWMLLPSFKVGHLGSEVIGNSPKVTQQTSGNAGMGHVTQTWFPPLTFLFCLLLGLREEQMGLRQSFMEEETTEPAWKVRNSRAGEEVNQGEDTGVWAARFIPKP